MKKAEQQEDDLLVNIGRLSYCANQNDWKRFEMLLRAFTNQVQSDAIESTVRRCAAEIDRCALSYAAGDSNIIMEKGLPAVRQAVLSLIPQKEGK